MLHGRRIVQMSLRLLSWLWDNQKWTWLIPWPLTSCWRGQRETRSGIWRMREVRREGDSLVGFTVGEGHVRRKAVALGLEVLPVDSQQWNETPILKPPGTEFCQQCICLKALGPRSDLNPADTLIATSWSSERRTQLSCVWTSVKSRRLKTGG